MKQNLIWIALTAVVILVATAVGGGFNGPDTSTPAGASEPAGASYNFSTQ